jgi:hypothetical protein
MNSRTVRFSLDLPSAQGINACLECDCVVDMNPSVIYDTPFGPYEGEEPGAVDIIEAVFVLSDKDGRELYNDCDYYLSEEMKKMIEVMAREEINKPRPGKIRQIMSDVMSPV